MKHEYEKWIAFRISKAYIETCRYENAIKGHLPKLSGWVDWNSWKSSLREQVPEEGVMLNVHFLASL